MSTQVSALSCLSGWFVLTGKKDINVLNVRKNHYTEAVSNSAKTFMSFFFCTHRNGFLLFVSCLCMLLPNFDMLIYPIRYCIPMCMWCHISEEVTFVAVLVIQKPEHYSRYSD
jgi:hypothetical protein